MQCKVLRHVVVRLKPVVQESVQEVQLGNRIDQPLVEDVSMAWKAGLTMTVHDLGVRVRIKAVKERFALLD